LDKNTLKVKGWMVNMINIVEQNWLDTFIAAADFKINN